MVTLELTDAEADFIALMLATFPVDSLSTAGELTMLTTMLKLIGALKAR